MLFCGGHFRPLECLSDPVRCKRSRGVLPLRKESHSEHICHWMDACVKIEVRTATIPSCSGSFRLLTQGYPLASRFFRHGTAAHHPLRGRARFAACAKPNLYEDHPHGFLTLVHSLMPTEITPQAWCAFSQKPNRSISNEHEYGIHPNEIEMSGFVGSRRASPRRGKAAREMRRRFTSSINSASWRFGCGGT